MPRGSRFLAEPTDFRNPETGQVRIATTKLDAIQFRADGYRPVAELDGDVAPAEAIEGVLQPFDPAVKGVAEVNAYLATAESAERDRVLAAEAAGKNRSTVAVPQTPESITDPAE